MFKSNKTKALIVGLPLLAFSACTSSDPSDTEKQIYKDISKGNFDDAIKYVYIGKISGKDAQDQKIEASDKLKSVMAGSRQNMQSHGGLKTIEILNKAITGNNAQVSYRLIFNDGTSQNATDSLIKTDGRWKVVVH